jgi:hypothetical protein
VIILTPGDIADRTVGVRERDGRHQTLPGD